MAGRKPKLVVRGKAVVRLMGLFDPFMRELVEMHYLQTSPALMDDCALAELIEWIHKTPYSAGLRLSRVAAARSGRDYWA